MPNVLLLGASGGMGRRVTALWRQEAPGVPLRLGVRRPDAAVDCGSGDSLVVAQLDDPGSMRSAMDGAAVVINAIGPYAYDPAPLLNACAAAAVSYVDLASEPEFLAEVVRWAERPDVPIAVCTGASTMPGMIELAARHLVERLTVKPQAFDVFLSMGSANPLTSGLLSSLTLQIGVPLRSAEGGLSYRRLRRRHLQDVGARLFGRYPSPFDKDGIDLAGGAVDARFWVGLDRAWIVHVLRAVSYVRPHSCDRTWISLVERVRPLLGMVRRFGGTVGGLRIEALDEKGSVLGAVNFRAGREGLNIPALPSVWAARALLSAGSRPGMRPLHELITFDSAAASLRAHGFEIGVEMPR